MGIGGAGMSGLAQLLKEMNIEVSGCDNVNSFYAEKISRQGVPIESGHHSDHLLRYNPDLLIFSSAISQNNPEIQAAYDKGILVAKRAEVLSGIFNVKRGVGVAGGIAGGAFDPRGEVGGGQDVGEALVPFEKHAEIRIGQKDRPLAALRRQKRGGQARGQGARARRDADGGPGFDRLFGVQAGKRPVEAVGDGDFGQPWLPRAPAVMAQKGGGGEKRIGGRGLQPDMAVAVAIHPALQDVLGQHLDHADLARPGAGGVQREVARGMKRDGGKDLRLEEVGAAAVMGQGEEGVPCVEIALDLAEIGLEGPEGQEDAAGDAVFGFGPGEDPVQFGGFRLCRGEAVLRDQRAREIEEGLAEHGLGAVGP